MSEKRKDSKGRILRTGESQRKDGKYEYKYVDVKGVRRSAYSWKLVDTDKVPAGKRCNESLRDIEKRLEEAIGNGIDINAGKNITFNECYQLYIQSKQLKPTTLCGYDVAMKRVHPYFGDNPIGAITSSDIRNCYLELSQKIQPATIRYSDLIVTSVFNFAQSQKYVKTNPAIGVVKYLYPSGTGYKKRDALTVSEQSAFLNYLRTHKKWHRWVALITVFLGTGCRANEVAGLQWSDCDFEKNVIHIRHGVHYISQDGKCHSCVTTPKTTSGKRTIPMMPEVRNALLHVKNEGRNCVQNIDGFNDFVFVTKNGGPYKYGSINYGLDTICRAYNKEAAQKQSLGEDVVLLPKITCHILRHTFCTRYCENETNIKIIQEIMGHANFSTTFEIYNNVTDTQKQDSMKSLESKIILN